MKAIIILSLCVWTGCVSQKEVHLGVRMMTRPIELVVEVKSAEPRFESAPGRYEVQFLVLEPEERRGTTLDVVMDGIGNGSNPLLTSDTVWRIDSDELVFDEQSSMGLTFMNADELNPRRTKRPNQPPQTTATSGRF